LLVTRTLRSSIGTIAYVAVVDAGIIIIILNIFFFTSIVKIRVAEVKKLKSKFVIARGLVLHCLQKETFVYEYKIVVW